MNANAEVINWWPQQQKLPLVLKAPRIVFFLIFQKAEDCHCRQSGLRRRPGGRRQIKDSKMPMTPEDIATLAVAVVALKAEDYRQ